jgi:hypothetical protein
MRTLLFSLLLLLAGCSGLGVRSPTSVDLTGTWQLDPARSDTGGLHEHQHYSDAAARQMPGQNEQPAVPGGGLTAEPNRDPHGHTPPPRLPMLSATEMTIAQDPTSMGIAYPNQPYRDLKWGMQKHDLYVVQAGWDKDRLIVETASAPLHIKETYSLSNNGNTLTLLVELKGKGFDSAHIVRVFTRRPTV